MRAHDPTPWNTERPMDFAFFNAIQRSPSFPPSDPWLSGYSINYYYFGYLLMAGVAQLGGLPPSAAYNLSLALIFALTALGVAGVIGNLIGLANREQGTGNREQGTGNREQRARLLPVACSLFPLLGAVLVLVAGNQSGAIQVLLGDERAVVLDGRQVVLAAGQALGGATNIVLPYPASSGDFGELSYWARQDLAAPGAFNWWWPSRSLWDEYTVRAADQPPRQERRYNITEFPLFSFRLGDMHPHVMSLPFTLLALALALASLARADAPSLTVGRAGWVELIVAGVILGSLYAINSWDLPTYLLLYAGAALILQRRLAGDGPIDWLAYARRLGLVIIASFLLFLPFYLTFRSLVGGAAPLIDLPIIGKITSIIAPYPDSRSGLHAFLIIFGLFALPLVAFVYLVRADDGRPTMDDQPPTTSDEGADLEGAEERSVVGGRWSSVSYLLPLALLIIGLLLGFPLLALAGLAALAFRLALRLSDRPAESFALLVVALGCAIIFGTEIIYIRDVFSTRMNTIFKFYYQVWLLWGTLTPFALWHILARAGGMRRAVGVGTAAIFALLLVGAGVYPALTLRDLGRGELIGLEAPTPREQTDGGKAAISWLRTSAAPGSVILEAAQIMNAQDAAQGAAPACGGSYNGDGFAGVSAASGLPTVLGWIGHEQQWRGGDPTAAAQLQPRCEDVYRIYSTTDAAQARDLLAKYGVRYVYVGGLERRDYAAESLAKFDQLGTPTSFGDGDVTIYTLR
jgi:YYY domain-containing protein